MSWFNLWKEQDAQSGLPANEVAEILKSIGYTELSLVPVEILESYGCVEVKNKKYKYYEPLPKLNEVMKHF